MGSTLIGFEFYLRGAGLTQPFDHTSRGWVKADAVSVFGLKVLILVGHG